MKAKFSDANVIQKKIMGNNFSKTEFEIFLSRYVFYEFEDDWYKVDWKYVDKKWQPKKQEVQEYCYLIQLNDEYSLRIYSSIDRRNNNSRGYAKDAIRIVPIETEILSPIRPPFKRINRGKKWCENFEIRTEEVLKSLGNKMKCEKCGKKCF